MAVNDNQNGQFRKLTREELFDLFKHWDQLAHTKENVLIVLAVAPFAGVCAAWDRVPAVAMLCVGCFSYLVYVYHLYMMDRFGELQDNTIDLLWESCNIGAIVAKPGRRGGVRNTRVLFLPALGLAWLVLSYLRKLPIPSEGMPSDASNPYFDIVATYLIAIYVVLSPTFVIWFWNKKPMRNRESVAN